MSTEFEVGGGKYRAGRLSAMTQFHVFRRLGPVIPALKGLGPALPVLMGEGGDLDAAAEALMPVADAIASMSDEDTEYVLGACLSVVQREQGGAWASVWSASAKRPMFDDINMMDMLQIAARVMMGSLGPF